MTPAQHRALAIAAMAEGRHEYNLGILSMLEKPELATAHQTACASADLAAKELEHEQAGNPWDGSFDGLLSSTVPRSARQIALQAALDEARRRRVAAWAPIQQIIDMYRGVAGDTLADWQS